MFKQSVFRLMVAASLCAAAPAWGQQALPAGPGRAIVEAKCNICHAFISHASAGYSAAGWTTVLRMMVNQGAPLTSEDVAALKPYLVENFPEETSRPAR